MSPAHRRGTLSSSRRDRRKTERTLQPRTPTCTSLGRELSRMANAEREADDPRGCQAHFERGNWSSARRHCDRHRRRLEAWYRAGAADGFDLMYPVLPVDLVNFAEQVMPELQRRGLTPTEYAEGTVR